jgi:hypothetical protein
MLYVSEICATVHPHRSCPTGGIVHLHGRFLSVWVHAETAMFGVVPHAIVCDFSNVWVLICVGILRKRNHICFCFS